MLKYVNSDVVFQEIPDEVTLCVNISNCPCHCPGCHSQYLWGDVGSPLTTEVIDDFVAQNRHSITCICFMGGDAEPAEVNRLARYVKQAYPQLKVGWYSGKSLVPRGVRKDDFDYIKLGPYLRHLGSLKEKTTNQRLYKHLDDGQFADITYRFWKK